MFHPLIMPLHVIIWPKSSRQQTQRELYAFNLDEATLQARFIEPYEFGEPISWGGRTLDGGDVTYMRITGTEHPFDEDAVRRSFQEYEALGVWARGHQQLDHPRRG